MNDTITRNPLDTDETGSSFKLLISELSESDGDNQNPATDTYKRSLSDLQLQNPESSIESTSPSLDRMGLFALLKA